MRVFKLIGALAIVVALTGLSTAAASAEVGFLPGKDKTPFTGLSGKAVLTSLTPGNLKLVVECTKSKSTGEITNKAGTDPATNALLTIDFEECKAFGLGVNSVGDPGKTILVPVEAKSCTISTSPLIGGVLLKPAAAVKLEVPTTKLTIEITGDVIGRLLPENKNAELFTLHLNAPEGKQEFKDCKDGVTGALLTEELKAKVDAEGVGPATEEAKEALLQFTAANAQTWDT